MKDLINYHSCHLQQLKKPNEHASYLSFSRNTIKNMCIYSCYVISTCLFRVRHEMHVVLSSCAHLSVEDLRKTNIVLMGQEITGKTAIMNHLRDGTSDMHTRTSSTLKARSFKSDNVDTNVCLVQRSCKLYHNILDYLQRLFWLEYLFKTIVKQSRSQSNNIKHKHVIFRRHLRTSNTITWRLLTCK